MSMQAFSNDELEVRKTIKMRGKDFEFFKTPISSRENILRLYEGKTPLWIPFTNEMVNLKPDCDPENVARSPVTRGGIDGRLDLSVPRQRRDQRGGFGRLLVRAQTDLDPLLRGIGKLLRNLFDLSRLFTKAGQMSLRTQPHCF